MALLGDILSVLSARLPATDQLPKYNYPSAGHLYPVQTLIFIPSNNYLGYYHPLNNCLIKLSTSNNLQDTLNNHRQHYVQQVAAEITPTPSTSPQSSLSSSPTSLTSLTSATMPKLQLATMINNPVYLLFIAERDAIEPVYGTSLSLEFCYLEVGYMEELIRLSLQDILEQHNTTATLTSLPINPADLKLRTELELTDTQIPLHILYIH